MCLELPKSPDHGVERVERLGNKLRLAVLSDEKGLLLDDLTHLVFGK